MTFATEFVQNYRLALQSLWNAHYWRDERFRDWDTVADFAKLQPVLFQALVAKRLEPLAEMSADATVFGSSYRVIPSFATGSLPTLFVNTEGVGTGGLTWQNLLGPFSSEQVNLKPIDLFDWNVRTWRDFRYYRVRILNFSDHPELIGREALVDVLDADVIWNPNE